MAENIILLTDSYKPSHWTQYPPKTQKIYSYLEARGGEFDETCFFGLYPILKNYLSRPISLNDIDEAEVLFSSHFGRNIFNRSGWDYILREHNGYLPLEIKAVAEGSVIPNSNVLMTIENTDPNCYWLTNYVETILSQVWYPSTVASLSRHTKKIIGNALLKSGDLSGLPFKLHDFGFRGVSSLESAKIGGAAHLVNFQGTDTLPALKFLQQFYKAEMSGFSIPGDQEARTAKYQICTLIKPT